MTYELWRGDCRDCMANMADDSVDAVVTDPPYELGFMGKAWDATGIAYDPELWREVLRVLKPGGHVVAFGGSRTYHRMGVAVENAGFEIRDQLLWLYGTGFPKSHDVSKAIDKARRRDFVAAAVKMGVAIPGNNLHDWTRAEHAPGDAWWDRFKAALPRDQWEQIERQVVGGNSRKAGWFTNGDGHDITASATPEAQQWEGWGTALKPAHEPIVLARKPLIGTVAANVLTHGVGGLNIDACRVGDGSDRTSGGNPSRVDFTPGWGMAATALAAGGRFPSNVMHDGSDAVVSQLPAKAGSAARFFYCAKASKADRNAGCDERNTHPTVKPTALMAYLCSLVTPPGGVVFDPFAGSGSTGRGALLEGFRFLGAEMTPEYWPIATARLDHAVNTRQNDESKEPGI